MKKGFLSNIVYSNILWGSGLLLLIAACLVECLLPETTNTPFMGQFGIVSNETIQAHSGFQWLQDSIWKSILGFIFMLGAAFGLQYMSSEFRLIRVRSYIPFFLACLLSAAIFPQLPLSGGWIANLILVFSFQRLLDTAEKEKSGRAAFDAGLFLAFSSLLEVRLAYLLPVLWLVMMVLQSMNARTFWSSLLGFMAIAWMMSGVSFLLNDFQALETYWKGLIQFQLMDVTSMSHSILALVAVVLFLVLIALSTFWFNQNFEKLKTRNSLNSFFVFWMGLLALWIVSGNDFFALLHLLTFSSLLMAHFFSLTDTLFSRMLFFLLIGVSIGAFLLP